MIKVLCFGTFDGIHDGHRAMLREARGITADHRLPNSSTRTYLIVAIAPDAVAEKLKQRTPRHSQAERIALLKKERLVDEVILADTDNGSWNILKKVKPQIIALGYDQDELRASLELFLEQQYPDVETTQGEWQENPKKPRIMLLSAYEPERLHNRILHS